MKRRLLCFSLLTAIFFSLAGVTARASYNPDAVVCLPVVMYHSVKPGKAGKDSITPWEFESDLKYLRENGFDTVTMSDVIRHVNGGDKLPEKPVMLTFDDGYYNNYKYVFPLLQKYGARVVLSVIAGATDKFSLKPSTDDCAHMTWDQLGEMLGSGCAEAQNHSYRLHAYGGSRIGCGQKRGEPLAEYNSVLCEDLEKAQERIYQMTGSLPSTFAYPYGKYNDNTVAILKDLGFKASLSCEYGVNLINKDGETDLFSMRRICRSHNKSVGKLLGEAMKTLKYR